MKYKYKESIAELSPYSSESRSDKDKTWLKLDWNESTFPLPEKIKKELSIENFHTSTIQTKSNRTYKAISIQQCSTRQHTNLCWFRRGFKRYIYSF